MRSVRDLRADELRLVVDYFVDADSAALRAMGVDRSKLPAKKDWVEGLVRECAAGRRYYVAWLVERALREDGA